LETLQLPKVRVADLPINFDFTELVGKRAMLEAIKANLRLDFD
jgi:hypothetical protein